MRASVVKDSSKSIIETKRQTKISYDILDARVLAILGDSVTTDHISPAGTIKLDSPAGRYLIDSGVEEINFNSYGSRKGNHEVMMRGTFANIRLKNEMVPHTEGGITKLYPGALVMPIYDAAMVYKKNKVPLVIFAGKEYGRGPSRDWAAKGTNYLGIRVVIAESFEKTHRSDLTGMGVLPLEFIPEVNRKTLGLDGTEKVEVLGLNQLEPRSNVSVGIKRSDGSSLNFIAKCRIDTDGEMEYFRND